MIMLFDFIDQSCRDVGTSAYLLWLTQIDESWGNNCEHLNTLVVVAIEANQYGGP